MYYAMKNIICCFVLNSGVFFVYPFIFCIYISVFIIFIFEKAMLPRPFFKIHLTSYRARATMHAVVNFTCIFQAPRSFDNCPPPPPPPPSIYFLKRLSKHMHKHFNRACSKFICQRNICFCRFLIAVEYSTFWT